MRPAMSVTILATMALLAVGIFFEATADDDHFGKWRRHDGRGLHGRNAQRLHHHFKNQLEPVSNEAYKETCGACHFAYQPGLLPSASWSKLLTKLQDHFGHAVDIDDKSRETIRIYLSDNAAEHSGAKPATRIMKCLRGHVPDRITEIPYIRHVHRHIASEVFARKAIGSLSNCAACHKTADQGVYDHHQVEMQK